MVALLVTLVGEIDMVAKNAGRPGQATDQEAIAILKKFAKGIDETLAVNPGNQTALVEKAVVASYLPQQLTEEDLEGNIRQFMSDGAKTIGDIQKLLKGKFPGQYDGALASKVAQRLLNS